MQSLDKAPAFKFLCGLLAGFLLFTIVPPPFRLFLFVLSCLSLLWNFRKLQHQGIFWNSALLSGFLLFLHTLQFQPVVTGWYPFIPAEFEGTIRSIHIDRDTLIRCFADGTLRYQGKEIPETALYLTINDADSVTGTVSPAASVYASVNVRPPRPPQLWTDWNEVLLAKAEKVEWIATTDGNLVSAQHHSHSFAALLWQCRKSIENAIQTLFPQNSSPIFLAMLTGDQSDIPYAQKRIFRITGTAHVFAVSGFHVGILTLILFTLFSPFRTSFAFPLLLTGLLLLFTLLTGARPSTVRATMMASLFLFLSYKERSPSLLNITAFVAVALLLISPQQLYEVGFQLSFAAVLGIALLYPRFTHRLTVLLPSTFANSKIIALFSVSAAAAIATTPVTAYHFAEFSWIAPVSNLLVLPLLSIAFIFAFIATSFSFLIPPLAPYYAAVAHTLLSFAQNILTSFAHFSPALQSPDAFFLSLLYVAALSLLLLLPSWRKALASASVLFLLLFLFLHQKPQGQVIIAGRDQLVLVDIAAGEHRCVILQDRRPYQPFRFDLGVLRYVQNITGPITLYAGGPIALRYAQFAEQNTIQSVTLPTLLFSSELFWSSIDYLDSCGIPISVTKQIFRCTPVAIQYDPRTNALTLAQDTVFLLPKIPLGWIQTFVNAD